MLLTIGLISTMNSASAETNRLGWEYTQAQRWSKLHNQNHPLWQCVRSEADSSATHLDSCFNNTFLVSGGLSSSNNIGGQTAFESNDSYLYHAGTSHSQASANQAPDNLPELIHEWTRSYLYLHNTDESDSVIVFDRLNNSDPLTDISTAEFGLLPSNSKRDIQAANAKHQWILHLPDSNPSIGDNRISWYSKDGEPVQLHSYLSSRFDVEFSGDQATKLPAELDPNELAYQIRLIPQQKSGWQTFLNVVHSGSDASTTHISASSGENAQGVLIKTGNDSVLAIFNGESGSNRLAPNRTSGSIQATHNQPKVDQIGQLRFFQSGFELEVDTLLPTKVYVTDLDPNHRWQAIIDNVQQPLVSSKAGLAKIDLTTEGSHTIKIIQGSSISASAATKQSTSTNSVTSGSASNPVAVGSNPAPSVALAASSTIVVDNRDQANTSSTGTWKASSATRSWKTDSVYASKAGTFRWKPNLPADGTYKVYAWWTHHSKRSANVPYTIRHSTGNAKVAVNQRNSLLAGRWNLLGTYQLKAGTAYVEVARVTGIVNADAVRFIPVATTTGIIIDNNDNAKTSSTGTWKVSSAPKPWGSNSLYASKSATYRWRPQLAAGGNYKVYAWWTSHNTRSTKAPYTIRHAQGTTKVAVNQRNRASGGRWNLLGSYQFNSGSAGFVELAQASGVVSADAVRFVRSGSTPPPPPPPPPPSGPKHWWTNKISSAPLHPNSSTQISTLSRLGGFGLGRMQIDFSFKVVRAASGAPKIPVAANKFGYFLPDSDPVGTTIPVPSGASIESSNGMTCDINNLDCHYIVKQGNTLYETFQATRSGGKLQARLLAVWDLNKNYPSSGRGEHCSSADAAGFPIEPLLWNADEIKNALNKDSTGGGDLGHAIRFILPNARMASDASLGGVNGRLYVRPASHAGAPSGPKNSVAYGARLRLRANFPTAGYNPAARVVINTMKRYGIALSDGGNIALTAESDRYTKTKWSDLQIGAGVFYRTPGAKPINVADFQVINTGSRIGETYNCVRNF